MLTDSLDNTVLVVHPINFNFPLRSSVLRFHEMSSDSFAEGALPPFLYGTHYSTPGYVMFWLVRAAPAHMVGTKDI